MTTRVVDIFAGGGGSSTGIAQVPGAEVIMAANHWQTAIDVHQANHPQADHAVVDLHQEDPRYFPPAEILWASPECTTWSQASGALYDKVPLEADLLSLLDPDLVEDDDPVNAAARKSRLLMFDVLRFAEHHAYPAMVVENVVEVATSPKFAAAW